MRAYGCKVVSRSQTLTLSGGESGLLPIYARTGTEVSVTITITNDAVCEPTETFELVMVPTNNFFAVKPVGMVTILDDDTRKLGIVG